VRRGDNLSAIASRYRVSVPDLKAWNKLRGNSINVGQVLRVPGSNSRGSSAAAPAGGSYQIRNGDNLATIASRYGVSVDDLKAWNGLRSNRIQAGDTLRVSSAVPQRQSNTVAASTTPEPSAAASGGQQRYRIRRGDSLEAIAQQHNVTVDQLKAWNGLRNSRIAAGEYLNIGAARASRPEPKAAAVAQPAARVRSADASAERYSIQRGDNLVEIARRYDVSIEDLQSWNSLDGSQITAGQFLTIRSNSSTPAGRYRIRRGDTLEDIAKRFGVTVDQLRAWNGLRNSRIHEGNYLTVRPEASANRGPGKSESGGGL
jgi:LysM repeat protein